jgi:hypothetical protein
MADPMTESAPRCTWCSALLPASDLASCPTCGATLNSTSGDADIKGVTTLDPEAILRARAEVARPRSRLLSFITGEAPNETGGPASAESLAPPDDAVRREMLRLQIEAERADLEAESVALKTDVVLEQGINLADLGDVPAAEEPSPEGNGPVSAEPAAASPAAAPPPPPA